MPGRAQLPHFLQHPGHTELVDWSRSTTIARHFASIYLKTDSLLHEHAAITDSFSTQLNLRFGMQFREAFLQAAHASSNQSTIPPVWAFYFRDSNRHPFTYWLLGVHAHIIGDMPVILAGSLSPTELRHHKRSFRRLNSVFDQQTDWAIQRILTDQKQLRIWHRLSFGMDRIVAKHIVHRWRAKAFRRAKRIQANRAPELRWERQFERMNRRLERLGKRFFRA